MWTVEAIREAREQIMQCPQTLGNVRDFALMSIALDALNEHCEGGYADRDRKNRRYEDGDQPFTEQTAEEWVASMVNEDPAVGRGGKWKPDDVRPFAKKYGIQTTGKQFAEFYAMMNAMYSDYSEVAKRYGVTDPGFFAEMAKAFIHDKDANPDKVQAYYEYIVKHN